MGKKWSKAEDEMLRCSVRRVVKGQTINWMEISGMIQGRTNKDCRKRWTKISSARRTGSWDEQEDSMLKVVVESVGPRWMVASAIVGTRTPDQCQKRWQNALKPELSNTNWTEAEDERLKAAVKTLGRNWTSISNTCFKQRSALSLSNRYAILCRAPGQNETPMMAASFSPAPTDGALSTTSLEMPFYPPTFAVSQHTEINLASDPYLDSGMRNLDFETVDLDWNFCHQAQTQAFNSLSEPMDNIVIPPNSGQGSVLMLPCLQHLPDQGANQHTEILDSIPPADASMGHNVWDPRFQTCSVGTTPKPTVSVVPLRPEFAAVESRDGTGDGRMTLILENVDQDTRDEMLGLLCKRRRHNVIKVDIKTR